MKHNTKMLKKAQTSPGWILILIFIFIMAGVVGLILYGQTKNYNVNTNQTDLSTANGNYKTPNNFCNSNSSHWQNSSCQNESYNNIYRIYNQTNITPRTEISLCPNGTHQQSVRCGCCPENGTLCCLAYCFECVNGTDTQEFHI